ncbi:uncharacterized protein (DUF1330 family) [Microbacterium ginsengiterrae]|uniref:Uncharacterized protein (DUF1330 family) n=1 Tax=Microbacterium ginsengiterrae TaxID=546115 RepID=A0A7W9CCU0_9MICO|nr:DUF1330 domain-containing protein [Microbacterium ginsengiterrae]MBB5743121.1 uncharacterized protein (DUF1330 family) [Microbacterium ginsengiterrae]
MSDDGAVPAYAVGLISDVTINEELLEYMSLIEATIVRFGGHWITHGRSPEIREGRSVGDIVVLGFPDLTSARAWYDSAEYQAIIPLRTRNSHAILAIVEGVPAGYTTEATIQKLRPHRA